jgi:hypothetical protein
MRLHCWLVLGMVKPSYELTLKQASASILIVQKRNGAGFPAP